MFCHLSMVDRSENSYACEPQPVPAVAKTPAGGARQQTALLLKLRAKHALLFLLFVVEFTQNLKIHFIKLLPVWSVFPAAPPSLGPVWRISGGRWAETEYDALSFNRIAFFITSEWAFYIYTASDMVNRWVQQPVLSLPSCHIRSHTGSVARCLARCFTRCKLAHINDGTNVTRAESSYFQPRSDLFQSLTQRFWWFSDAF